MPLSRNDLKIYSSLHRRSKRIAHGLFIAEGIKICQELIKSDFTIESLLITDGNQSLFPDSQLISQKDADRISNLKTHPGVIAIVKIPSISNALHLDKTIIAIDGINDPGNLGNIIRTLDWFGFDQLVCSNKSVDSYNPKTVMSSMGSIFRVRTHYVNMIEFLNKNKTIPTLGSFTKGKSIYEFKLQEPSIIILGNESHGISEEILPFIDQQITIPGNGLSESLNINNSAAIIISEIFRRKN